MTMSCGPGADPFRCPTKWELFEVLRALLPRGRAWQTHDHVEEWARFGAASGVAGVGEAGLGQFGLDANVRRLTVMQQYWAAFAEVLEYFHQRACALLDEWFCATARETLDHWHADYGFPSECEPYSSLCDKVAAMGGATCAYFVELAASRGWTIECGDCAPESAGCLHAGGAGLCACENGVMFIRVYTAESPAYSGNYISTRAGDVEAGCHDPCGPSADALVCLIEKYKPAHVRAIYEVV
ncbi:MAG: putative phage tail protein [Hyphomicrobiales bacterium]|nr:putative phage tail protein [Hyphomicrobiales bacterium]